MLPDTDTSRCSERWIHCVTPLIIHKFHEHMITCSSFLFPSHPGVLFKHFPALYSLSAKIFYLLIFFSLLRGFSYLYIYSVTSALRQLEGLKGHGKVERAGWVRGFEFTKRVEDCIFPKKTGAAIWVEVMDISMHADRIGGSVGGERPLKTKWTKSSWFECSSAPTLPNVL